MSAQSVLEQLLKSGLSMMQGSGAQNLPQAVAQRPGAPVAHGSRDDVRPGGKGSGIHWGSFAGGAASGGALGLLLGSKRGRHIGGKVLKVGSVAALGALAYKVYTHWQANQRAAGAAQPVAGSAPPAWPGAAAGQPAWAGAAAPAPGGAGARPDVWDLPPSQVRTVDRVQPGEAEGHSRAMLKAMIAAAKSDGHLDDRERGLLEGELNRLEADPALRRWLDDEVRRPLDPADVARAAEGSPALAAEMYLASLLVADETSFMERAYLDELARQLQLPASLKADLEAQAAAA